MIKPVKKDPELFEEIYARPGDPNSIDIWWLGQSGYLIHWNGIRLLLDPYLSDSLSKKYLNTDKPHTRMSELVIEPSRLQSIDFITSSHAHTDHLDPETLAPILLNNPQVRFIIPEAHRSVAATRAHCDLNKPIGLTIDQTYSSGQVVITAVPASHESVEKDENGNALYLGYIIRLGRWTLYHSGDTVLYPGMADLLRPHSIDLSFLPINGSDPARKVAGNLNATEAVWLADQIKTNWVIPGHYHMFEFNTVEPDDFIRLASHKKINFKIMQLGELFTLTK